MKWGVIKEEAGILHQIYIFNPLSANPTKWPNTLKQFVGKLPANCLSAFGHIVQLALKGSNNWRVRYRNCRAQFFFKKVVLKKLTKFRVKHLCWSLFLLSCRLSACNIIKRLQLRCFPVNFAIFLEAIISQNTSGRFLLLLVANLFRSSHRKYSVRKNVLRNFAKFTRKHMSQSLFFNKVSGLRPPNLLKKRPWLRRFPMNFAKFLRTTFLTEHFRWYQLRNIDGHHGWPTKKIFRFKWSKRARKT